MSPAPLRPAVKASGRVVPRVYSATLNHFQPQAPEACLSLRGPDRFGAIVLEPKTGFNPRKVQISCDGTNVTHLRAALGEALHWCDSRHEGCTQPSRQRHTGCKSSQQTVSSIV